MMQIIQQTDEERVAMYMKLSKRELVDMLIENQRMVASLCPEPIVQTIGTRGNYTGSNWSGTISSAVGWA